MGDSARRPLLHDADPPECECCAWALDTLQAAERARDDAKRRVETIGREYAQTCGRLRDARDALRAAAQAARDLFDARPSGSIIYRWVDPAKQVNDDMPLLRAVLAQLDAALGPDRRAQCAPADEP